MDPYKFQNGEVDGHTWTMLGGKIWGDSESLKGLIYIKNILTARWQSYAKENKMIKITIIFLPNVLILIFLNNIFFLNI